MVVEGGKQTHNSHSHTWPEREKETERGLTRARDSIGSRGRDNTHHNRVLVCPLSQWNPNTVATCCSWLQRMTEREKRKKDKV